MTEQQKTLLSIVLVITVIGGALYFYNQKDNNQLQKQVQIQKQVQKTVLIDTITETATGTTSNINNDILTKRATATVNFNTPGGVNIMTVSVSMANGMIGDVSFEEEINSILDRKSAHYKESFTTGLDKSKFIGKKLSDVSLSRVGGASLTTRAFMDALNQAVVSAL